ARLRPRARLSRRLCVAAGALAGGGAASAGAPPARGARWRSDRALARGKRRIVFTRTPRARGFHATNLALRVRLEKVLRDIVWLESFAPGTQQYTQHMKLIGSLTSPYVRKVRVVLAEKKLDYQFVLEDVWGSDAILKMNPLGKVPCLVMEGQDTITGSVFDSRVIVEYLDTLSPVGKLIPPSGRERIEVRTWEALADGVCDPAILAR